MGSKASLRAVVACLVLSTSASAQQPPNCPFGMSVVAADTTVWACRGAASTPVQVATGTGTATGTNTGDQSTVSGNAGTATTLQNARNINGVSFNGSADVTVPAAAGTLTGTTLASGVTVSSLASLGAAAALTTTGNIGYATGAGGTVTQLTSKATGVTLNTKSGTITTHNASLAAATIVTFTVTNSQIAATDLPLCTHDSGGTIGAYTVVCNTSAVGSFKVTIRNNTAGALVEALVVRFAVLKGAVS